MCLYEYDHEQDSLVLVEPDKEPLGGSTRRGELGFKSRMQGTETRVGIGSISHGIASQRGGRGIASTQGREKSIQKEGNRCIVLPLIASLYSISLV